MDSFIAVSRRSTTAWRSSHTINSARPTQAYHIGSSTPHGSLVKITESRYIDETTRCLSHDVTIAINPARAQRMCRSHSLLIEFNRRAVQPRVQRYYQIEPETLNGNVSAMTPSSIISFATILLLSNYGTICGYVNAI